MNVRVEQDDRYCLDRHPIRNTMDIKRMTSLLRGGKSARAAEMIPGNDLIYWIRIRNAGCENWDFIIHATVVYPLIYAFMSSQHPTISSQFIIGRNSMISHIVSDDILMEGAICNDYANGILRYTTGNDETTCSGFSSSGLETGPFLIIILKEYAVLREVLVNIIHWFLIGDHNDKHGNWNTPFIHYFIYRIIFRKYIPI